MNNSANPSCHRPHTKRGYLYIHYHDSDAIKIIMMFNARRIARNKQPYPVLVESSFEKFNLILSKNKIIRGEEMRSLEKVVDGRPTSEQTPVKLHYQYQQGKTYYPLTYKKREALLEKSADTNQSPETIERNINIYLAFEQTQIILDKLPDLGEHDKLYILGHGKAGVPKLGSGINTSEDLHIRNIVERLKSSGLSKAIKDIRIDGCESADGTSRYTFNDYSVEGLIYKLRNYKNTVKSAAMIFSQELSRAGYQDVRVYGYHGYGIFYSSLSRELHRERIVGTMKYDVNKMIITERKRASLVRQVYVNGEKISSARLNCCGV